MFLQDFPQDMAIPNMAVLWEALQAIKSVNGFAPGYARKRILEELLFPKS